MEHDKELEKITESFVAYRLHSPRFAFSEEFTQALAKEYKSLRAQNIKMDRVLRGITFKVHEFEDEQKRSKHIKPAEDFTEVEPVTTKVDMGKLDQLAKETQPVKTA